MRIVSSLLLPLTRIWILQLSLSLSLRRTRLAFILGLFYIYAYGQVRARGSGQRTHPWVCEEIKRISAASSLAAAVGSYKRSTGELDELLARAELIDQPLPTRGATVERAFQLLFLWLHPLAPQGWTIPFEERQVGGFFLAFEAWKNGRIVAIKGENNNDE